MPVLSMHNTYSLPSGSASYTLGLSGAPGASSYTYPTGGVGLSGIGGLLGTTGLTGTSQVGGLSGLIGNTGLSGLSATNPLSNTLPNLGGFNSGVGGVSSYSTYTNPLLTTGAMNIKLKTYDELDMIRQYAGRGTTPNSPLPPPSTWGLDSYNPLDGCNPTFLHTHTRLGGHELERKLVHLKSN